GRALLRGLPVAPVLPRPHRGGAGPGDRSGEGGAAMSMPAEFRIGDRLVGPGHPTYVIAEAGANHNRDLGMARELIDVAAAAGADAVKFQTYSGATMYSRKTPRFKYLAPVTSKPPTELLEDISLPREWQPELAAHARAKGLEFMSTPFDLAAVREL